MKKALIRAGIALVLVVFVGYIALMAAFEGPIVADITDRVEWNVEEQSISLPWYLRVGTDEWYRWTGTDADGSAYTRFSYSLPELFEFAGMECVVSWNAQTAMLYVGESRAMEVIDSDFPDVQWK